MHRYAHAGIGVVLLALTAMLIPTFALAVKPVKYTATCEVRFVPSEPESQTPGHYDATFTGAWTGGDPYEYQFGGGEPLLVDDAQKAANSVQTTFRAITQDLVGVRVDFFGRNGKTIGTATADCRLPV